MRKLAMSLSEYQSVTMDLNEFQRKGMGGKFTFKDPNLADFFFLIAETSNIVGSRRVPGACFSPRTLGTWSLGHLAKC